MDIAALSVVMSQSRVQTEAGIAIAKIAIDTNKENGNQMTEMMSNTAVDHNLGQHLDVTV